jgi:hypothetical protein
VAVKTNMRRPLLVSISWSFYKDDKVILNPLRVKHKYAAELEHSLVLFYTGNSRESARIIEKQSANVTGNKTTAIEAMQELKNLSVKMKESILMGDIDNIGTILHHGWQSKKKMAVGISSPAIDELYTPGSKEYTIIKSKLQKSISGYFFSILQLGYPMDKLKEAYMFYSLRELLPLPVTGQNTKTVLFNVLINLRILYVLHFVRNINR